MTDASTFPALKRLSLILVCALLGACATTQRSNSGAGQQAAPISESATSQTTDKPGESAKSSAPGAASRQNSNAASSADTPASSAAGASQRLPENGVASGNDDDAAQLKRQLAEQDAQINKLRNDQQLDAAREEMPSKQEQGEAATRSESAAESVPASVPDQQASAAAAAKADDQIAVFPSNTNAPVDTPNRSAVPSSTDRSVYFAFDQAMVGEKYDSMLMTNAAFLKAHANFEAEVQGNCDERGSREYNLALGARRAEAVKRALELAGADGRRITTVSFGSEKPVAPGRDEESYSKNRRADIVY